MEDGQIKNTSTVRRNVYSSSAPNLHISSSHYIGHDPAGDEGHSLSAKVSIERRRSQLLSQNLANDNKNKNLQVTFSVPDSNISTHKLTCTTKLLVASGHILNDLCASLWFSYLLLYLQNVVGFTSEHAAILLLLGQIVGGVATPLVGYTEDKVHNCYLCRKNYGRFKSWLLIGSVLVICTFPFIFAECLGCMDQAEWARMVYYAPFIAVFQVGWAMNHISHLALIPKVDPDEIVRTELLAIRHGFTVCSNVTIFMVTGLILGFSTDCTITHLDAPKFRNIACLAVGIGCLSTIVFHSFVTEESDENVVLKSYASASSRLALHHGVIPTTFQPNSAKDDVKEPEPEPVNTENENTVSGDFSKTESERTQLISSRESPQNHHCHRPKVHQHLTIKDWLKTGQFYNVAAIYTCTRLTVNLTQCYIPLYLQDTLMLPCSTVATVPLTMYLSGLFVSFFVKYINSKLGRMFCYLLGVILSVAGSVCILYLDWSPGGFLHQIGIYIVAALLGGGASALLVTSLATTADLIGANIEHGAFVYGSMSFCDKICCGLVIMLINKLAPCQYREARVEDCEYLPSFYRHVLGYSCAVCSISGFVAVSIRSYFQRLEKKRNK